MTVSSEKAANNNLEHTITFSLLEKRIKKQIKSNLNKLFSKAASNTSLPVPLRY